MNGRLLLIDANSIIHRAFHALPPFTSSSGEPTGALYGLASALLKLIKEQRPAYAAAFFDRPEPTFRDKLYADYKAHRPPTAETLIPQIQEAPNLFAQFSIHSFSEAGFEADDLIGTFAERFKKTPGITVVVLSGDQDLLQLVENDKVLLAYMRKGISDFTLYNEESATQKLGLPPLLLPDYKGLAGDPSDNIPGVTGIGSKTARELLGAYGSIEKIFAHIKELSPALERKLEGKKDQALMSKNLATIHRMATMPHIRLADLTLRPLDETILVPYFTHLGFHSLTRRLYTNSNTLL